MTHSKCLDALLFVLLAVFAWPSTVLADGIIVPEPPIPCQPWEDCEFFPLEQLNVRYHRVNVTIEDQIALTHVDQVFHNPNDWQIEGTYIFPIPADATVTEFTLWIDGEPVRGEVLSAEEARATYEEIVRQMIDPALLEYVGQGAVKASIFPIPPDGERRIELEYSQPLTAEGGLVKYVYPLNTEKFSVEPLENVSVSVDVHSNERIRTAYSPTHRVDVVNEGPHHIRAGYEDFDVKPDADFALYYSIGEAEAFHLLSYRDPSDENGDGFFMALLAPRPEVEPDAFPKDVILVLDKSGSMDWDGKFEQAQEALRFILQNLNEEDRFNVITFSTGIESYADGLRPADEALDAVRWVNEQFAIGSTDINRALTEAAYMASSERPTYVIFMTDGLPTEGVTESARILANFERSITPNVRLFAFGVGFDVDTFLLDSLAQSHAGTSSYVLPGERLDEMIGDFYQKIRTPVLTDLQLDFGDITVYDLYPNPLPDLFSGSQVIVVGRYRGAGLVDVELKGQVNGQTQVFDFPEQHFSRDSRRNEDVFETLPRLWATRKIGHLLNQIRLSGPEEETIEQVVRLSIRYGIVTPYTSYLVTEAAPLGQAEQDRIAVEAFSEMEAMPSAPTSGEDAVQEAAEQGALAGAEAPAEEPAIVAGVTVDEVVQNVGAHTFVLNNGVWIDTAFDPTMSTIQVAFLSDDYFDLVAASSELAAAFALGERVIALADGDAYEVVGADESVPPVDIPEVQRPEEEAALEPGQASINEPALEESDGGGLGFDKLCFGIVGMLAFLPLAVGRRKG